MRTQRLGHHGPELSVIGFGAMEVGETDEWPDRPSDDALLDVIRSAPDVGINWIDTAEIYGNGNSERLVGEALVGRRDEVLIATKVAPDDGGSGFRPDQVRSACHASLTRLQTDRIDLYQLHWWPEGGDDVPIEETWGTMVDLVDEGKARYIGLSNFNQEQIERCLTVRHIDSLQQQFSLIDIRDAELIRWCGEQGIGVVSYGPLGYGVFRPTMLTDEDLVQLLGPETPIARRQATLELVRDLHPIAVRIGVPLSQLPLAWNVQQPGVTSAIAGSTNPMHIRENAEASDVVLDATTLNELNDLAQGFQEARILRANPAP